MIAVFGSINIDFITTVDRLAAPGETVISAGSYEVHAGGKGANQALAARRAGAEVMMAGAVGRDGFAESALSLLREAGVLLTEVVAVDASTGAAFISTGRRSAESKAIDNVITVAAGANWRASAEGIRRRLAAGDVLLLQREVPDAESEIAARHARDRGARVVLNLAPSGAIPDSYLKLVDVMVVNEHEARDLAEALALPEDHAGLATGLASRFGIGATVVTLGPEGAFGWQGGTVCRVPCPKVKVVDTTAAGDTFVGYFAAALGGRLPFADALRRGAAAGSLACTMRHAQPSIPKAAAVEALLRDQEF